MLKSDWQLSLHMINLRAMKPMKFKTNIKCSGCVAKVTPGLNETAGAGKWDVDLSSPERVLTITTAIPEDKVKEALEKVGYKAEKI
jgi:copper chaperone